MRNFLLRLLGAHRPVVIEFDQTVIDAAVSGAVIILHTRHSLIGEARDTAQKTLEYYRKQNPNLRFLLFDGDVELKVIHTVSIDTSVKLEQQ